MKHGTSNRKQQSAQSSVFGAVARNQRIASAGGLSAQIERVAAYAVAERGTFSSQVEAAKKALPASTPVVMAGKLKRFATR